MNGGAWPDGEAYRKAVEQPGALGDPELQPGTVERLPGGLARMYSGTFTTTFHFAAADGGVALRCFTRGSSDIQRRYSALSELVRYVHNDALCRTRYLPRGIRVGSTWWPAVAMQWVDGRPLNDAVASLLHDTDSLLALARQFREMVRSLEVLGIAHGDLQHGNILVERGKLRLIDYDAMFLPALAGLPQTEYGHPNYQHPARRTAAFDGRLDRFSSIVIYTALVALAADPSLWHRFDDGNNLLFRAHDFTSNGSSELFRALLSSNAAYGLATALIAASNGPVEGVPSLQDVIEGAAGTMPATRAIPMPPPRHRVVPVDPATTVTPRVGGVSERDSTRRRTPAIIALGALLLAAGAAAGYAVSTRSNHPAATRVAVRSHPAKRLVAARPMPTPSVVPTASATVAPTASRSVAPTASPSVAPTASPSIAPTPSPISTATVLRDASALAGSWRIDEANVQAGNMVWVADAAVSQNGTIVLHAHKESIGGRAASPCERGTNLRVAFVARNAPQTVPYDEVNCVGGAMSGQVRVDNVSPDGTSFSGSFWHDGAKLGDFEARKL